jgi:hypothetical protein
MTHASDNTNPESDARPKLPAEADGPADASVRPYRDPYHSQTPSVEPRPPRMSRALRIGLIYLVVCLIAGVLLLLYSLRSVVTDLGNNSP